MQIEVSTVYQRSHCAKIVDKSASIRSLRALTRADRRTPRPRSSVPESGVDSALLLAAIVSISRHNARNSSFDNEATLINTSPGSTTHRLSIKEHARNAFVASLEVISYASIFSRN